jgi:hypothetical protein
MGVGSKPGWLGALSIAAVVVLLTAATNVTGSTLPRNVVVPLSAVNRFFPEISQEASSGQNLTAAGNPTATMSAIYATSDGSKKVTITVDQYGSPSDAWPCARRRSRAMSTAIVSISGEHCGGVAVVAKLCKFPLRLRGLMGGLWRRTAPDNFAHVISDCCRIHEAHPRQPLEDVRRGELSLDFRGCSASTTACDA